MLPAMRFTTIFVWTNQHSIATIIWALYTNEEFFLCFVIFTFSIFFPFLKLFYLLTLVTSPDMPAEFRDKSILRMERLGDDDECHGAGPDDLSCETAGETEASLLPGSDSSLLRPTIMNGCWPTGGPNGDAGDRARAREPCSRGPPKK